MKTIAVIDDDTHIGNLLETVLREQGYAVLRAYSGTEAQLLLAAKRPDLILLDLMLPGLSGEELLPGLQGVPVIIISAKAGVDDKVSLLMNGAADYITKPFEMKEVLARIAVQLRKAQASGAAATLSFGSITMDCGARQVSVKGACVHLTRTEFAILKLLLQNPTQVLTKSLLLDRISIDTSDCTEGSLKIHVSNLRKKLRDASGRETIEAVWGIGFRLIAP